MASPMRTGSTPQMSAQSSPQPAPAVAVTLRSFSPPRSTDDRTAPTTASGRPMTARPVTGSPSAMANAAPNPPPSAASGPTTDSLPTASPLSRQAMATISIGPVSAAMPAARHSSAPVGSSSRSSHRGRRIASPTSCTQNSAVSTGVARTTRIMR